MMLIRRDSSFLRLRRISFCRHHPCAV